MSNAPARLQLKPFERRLLVGVLVILFVVVNWVFVWPHFGDWARTRDRLDDIHSKIGKWTREIALKDEYEKKIKTYEEEGGASVTAEDQANQFLRTVQNQASVSGVTITSISRQSTRTNEFFLEQLQTFRVTAGEEQLIEFLYDLGSGESIIRARSLAMHPNGPRQQLEGSIDLVASYQKNPKKPAPKPASPAPTPTVKKP
jgi:Tfp pilus assembly protein PilO